MSFFSWLRNRKSNPSPRGRAPRRPAPRGFRPQLEALEDRALPSTFHAATASDLIADIKAANLQGGANSIVLTAPATSHYVLTAADNNTNGYNALPVIAPGDALTIQTGNGSANPGYGDTIDASKAGRLFDVAQGASLTLDNLTLQNGYVNCITGGGAIYNQGTLDLSRVLVQNNTARGYLAAAGCGIWSNGSLSVENSCVFQGNVAQAAYNAYGGAICIVGGTANITGSTFGSLDPREWNKAKTLALSWNQLNIAYGGAVYVGGGTVTMSGDSVGLPGGALGTVTNSVQGDYNGTGNSYGFGGGLCVSGGTVTLTNDLITRNEAGYNTGFGGNPGVGGGIFLAYGAHWNIDAFTQANTRLNYADFGPDLGYEYGAGWGEYPHKQGYVLLPKIGSFTASPNPVTVGSSLTLTASNISYGIGLQTTTQVSFYYLDSSGAKHVLGNATQTSTGVWTLTVKVNLAPGTYTLFAQAESSFDLFSNPVTLTLTVH